MNDAKLTDLSAAADNRVEVLRVLIGMGCLDCLVAQLCVLDIAADNGKDIAKLKVKSPPVILARLLVTTI